MAEAEDGSIPGMGGKIIIDPIREGLQLFVTFKEAPSLEYMKANFEGFHSRSSKPTKKQDSTSVSQILLFTSIESLEAAKTKLNSNENVEFLDYMGIKSAKNQVSSLNKLWYHIVTLIHFSIIILRKAIRNAAKSS